MRAFRVFVVAAALALACSKSDTGPDAGAPAPVALTPVPAPAGLVAELIVPRPEELWGTARATIGGPAAFLPSSIGGLATTLLGMPITAATELDGETPAVGALVDGGAGQEPLAVIGLHVRDSAHLVLLLAGGDVARFSTRTDPATGITLLEPRGAKGPAALGMLGNWLLVAPTEKALLDAGPYVARTLPTRPAPKHDATLSIPPAALTGPLRQRLERASRELESPDAPASLVGPLRTLTSVLGDLESARLTLDWDDAAARLNATALPAGPEGAASLAVRDMASGKIAPVLALPAETSLGVLFHESAASRAASAARQADALGALLGGSLPDAEKKKVAERLESLATARGDWVALGLRFDEKGPAGYARAGVTDGDAMQKGMKALVGIAKDGAFKGAMKDAGIVVKSDKTRVDGMTGEIDRVRFERSKDKKDAAPGLPASVDLLYAVRDDSLLLAAGLDAKDAMADLAAASSGDSLATKAPAVKAALESLGSEVILALVLEPLLLVASRAGKQGAGESAPVLVAFGTKKEPAPGSFWARIDVSNVAIRELVKHRGAVF